jgi:hypothetical protein
MIKEITVVGGGSSGWMTAATLIRSFPNIKINIIEPEDSPTVGVGESTLLAIRTWTRYIGISENDFFKECDATIKMSIKFTDFYKKNSGGFHYPFGTPYHIEDRNPFYDWQLKKYFYPETPVSDMVKNIIPSSFLYEKNKFSVNEFGQFDNYDVSKDLAYQFDATKFANWIKNKYCIPRGVNLINSSVKNISVCENGIEFLVLKDGHKITSDLFVDCTGFSSLLLGKALKENFEDYSYLLPNNRAWATKVPYKNKKAEIEPFTNGTAIDNGWCWNIPLWSRIGSGYVYSDRYTDPDSAKKEFISYLKSSKMVIPRNDEDIESLEFRDIKMRVGIHSRTFVKNVVAIGLSAGFIEPLESNGLFSVHTFLFKLITAIQRGDVSQFDRDMYNTNVREIFDTFAKFVVMHYSLSHRDDTEYWRAIKERSFIDSRSQDPYSPYLGKSDSFYDFSYRLMSDWYFPFNDSGIPFIATGMNIQMFNDFRINDIEFRTKRNLKKEIDDVIKIWDSRKLKWENAANNSLHLIDFMKNNFDYD